MSSDQNKEHLLQLRASSSNYVTGETSTHNLFLEERKRGVDIQQLEGKLRQLEEEAEMLKGEILEGVEERTKLMNEIYMHFETIQHCLVQREVEITTRVQTHSSNKGETIISFLNKDRRAGLLQVLCQESNPSLVKRGLRVNTLI